MKQFYMQLSALWGYPQSRGITKFRGLFLALLFMCFAHAVQAQMPSDFDKTFGNGANGAHLGLVKHYPPGARQDMGTYSKTALVAKDGSVFVGGFVVLADYTQAFGLIKLQSDGRLDETWGTSGGATIRNEFAYEQKTGTVPLIVTDFDMQADGKILGVGQQGSGYDGVVVRFNADGTPDMTFGYKGMIVQDISGWEIFKDVLIQPDGKILAAGSSFSYESGTGSSYGVLARYNPDGSLDASFGGNGTLKTKPGTVFHLAFGGTREPVTVYNKIMLLPDGKILAVGHSGDGYTGENDKTIIARYNPNGSLDGSFGNGGILALDLTGNTTDGEYASAVQLKSDGTYLIGGLVNKSPVSFGSVINVNPNGSQNMAFGDNGILKINQYPGGNTQVAVHDIQYDRKGGLYVSGGNYRGFVCRITPDGKVDNTFYNNSDSGHALILDGLSAANSIAFDANNKLLATGTTNWTYTTYRLMNTNPAGALNFDGTNDYVVSANNIGISGAQPRTMEYWAKLKNRFEHQVQFGALTQNSSFGTFTNNNQLYVFAWANDYAVPNFTPDGQWHHVAVTYNGTVVKVYIDGIEKTPAGGVKYNLNTTNTKLYIGARQDLSLPFLGDMDEVRVWNRALCQSEIQNNMNAELPSPTTQNGLVAYYKLNNSSAGAGADNAGLTSAVDASSMANTGTLTNFALTGTTSNWILGKVTGTAGTFEDKTPPTITCPANINVAATSATGAIVNYVTPVGKDDCDATTVMTSGLASGSTFPIGTTTVTYKVTDAAGLTAECSFDVTVTGLPPKVVCPSNITVSNAVGKCGANVDFAATETTAVPASTITYSHQPGSFFPVGTTTVTATATNEAGTSSCTFTVTVNDTEKPIFGNMVGNPVASNTSSQPGVFIKNSGAWHGPSPYHHLKAAAADFDGDGDLDLAYTTNNSPAIYLNNGKGVMTAGFTISGYQSHSVATGDLNGDGKPDIIYGSWASGTPTSRVYMNNGNGTFTLTQSNVGGVDRVNDVALADLDGDGDLDAFFVGSGYNNRNHRVYFNDGNGHLTPSTQLFNSDDWGTKVVLRDFNGDGTIDAFVTADWPANSSRLWINNGSGQFSASGPSFVNGYGIDAADFDKDGDMDIIYATSNTSFAFLINNGTGSFTQSTQVFSNPEGHKPSDVKFADIDNDQDVDIIVGYSASPRIYLNDGFGQYSLGNTIPLEYRWDLRHMIFADMDGDQDLDFVDAMAGSYNEVVFNQFTHPFVTGVLPNIEVNNTPGQCGAIVTFTNAFSDNCPGATVAYTHASGSFFPVGITTVTGEVTDNAGNKTTGSFTVTVKDTQAPNVITQNITVNLDATGAASITADQINNGSTDNCAIASYSLDKTSFGCENIGANTVILTATDVNGNVSTAQATVTVEDKNAPVALAKNITVQLDASGAVTIAASDINNGSSDACGIKSMSISTTTFGCANVGDNTVTLTVTDNNGNIATATAIVTVEDKIIPIAKAQDLTIELNANGVATITAAAVDNGSADVCGDVTLALSQTTFNCANVGANTVTLTVTDNSGNKATVDATITVVDRIAPVALAKNITVQLDAAGNATIAAGDVDNGSADVCGDVILSIDKTTFTCSNIGQNTVILTVTDAQGNASEATAIVTVKDELAPVVVTRNITVGLDANGVAAITPDMINNGSADNCGIPATGYSLDKMNFSCENVGPNTVTLTVTDVNGNTTTETAIVTIEDKVAPIAKAKDITVQLDATGNVTITAQHVDNGSSDNCGIATTTLDVTSFDCSKTGANTVTLTVTDNAGNVHTATAVVTVEDKLLPTITAPANVVTDVDAGKNTASGVNLGSPVTADNCSVAEVTNDAPAVFPTGTTLVTWTVTDASGNRATATQTVTVRRDVVAVARPASTVVPIRTAYASLQLPAKVTITYSDGSTEAIGVNWAQGNYNGMVAGNYNLTGTLVLAAGTTNTTSLTAAITVVVEPNKVPTALAFSATTFKPDAKADDVIGTLTTTDADDTEFVYTLVAGDGDTGNSLFEIRGDKVYLKSNNGLSGKTTFSIRVQSTDPYQNPIAKAFTLTKENYSKAVDQLKIVNAFSPNGDGINDAWAIPELRFYNNVEVEVFDRSGVRLFHTTNPEMAWDGRSSNGQILKGGFFYVVQVKDINLVKKGVVTILKK